MKKLHNLWDKIVNNLLNAKVWVQYHVFKQKHGSFKIPSNLKLFTFQNFLSMSETELNNLYRKNQAWGDYHPADLQQWYDDAAVSLLGGLNLSITDNTKVVTSYMVNKELLHNQPPVTINHGVGLCASYNSYGHGIFEWDIKLPLGVGLWPAVWLSSANSWPPEIDVIEAYSDEKGRYQNRLETNIHVGSNGDNHYSLGAVGHGWFINTNEILNLKCYWTQDFIKIYYNDFLCRIIKNKTDLKWFDNKRMIVIVNAALRKNIITNVPTSQLAIAPLKILNFKHYADR